MNQRDRDIAIIGIKNKNKKRIQNAIPPIFSSNAHVINNRRTTFIGYRALGIGNTTFNSITNPRMLGTGFVAESNPNIGIINYEPHLQNSFYNYDTRVGDSGGPWFQRNSSTNQLNIVAITQGGFNRRPPLESTQGVLVAPHIP